MFKAVRRLKKSSTSGQEVETEEGIIMDDKIIANKICEFFSKLGQNNIKVKRSRVNIIGRYNKEMSKGNIKGNQLSKIN